MKTEHIRNAIDTQRGVMTQIIEKQGVLLRFSLRMLPNSMSFCSEFINVEIFQQKTFFLHSTKKSVLNCPSLKMDICLKYGENGPSSLNAP